MQRPSPTRMRPLRRLGSSGRNAHASASLTPFAFRQSSYLVILLVCCWRGARGTYHEERRNEPIQDKTKGCLFPQLGLSEYNVESLVADVAKDGVHHDQEADCLKKKKVL